MSFDRLKTNNAFVASLLVFFSLTACSTSPSQYKNQHVLPLDSASFAQYWVAKDKLIDWRKALPAEFHSDSKENTTHYKASFIVDSHGQLTQLEIINSVTGELLEQAALADISSHEFYPTAQNSALQAVQVNTSFRL
ncbi:hypothetical protein swp_0336 [Shewanella piezotolerans WP3]|uniref:TonB C-terminal domain-containing protein n=1 Tax=Shewanella piezotolerans (strain WP3 / JCM 13877) TaxID=225849 RepID=B8CHP5_SHEPW|nr:energy transducer TonB [Shewanella piezotolerans]ACJ27171.1 hypothetical protein swp_0336 [Shewanella piezotolerans WP3]